MHGENRSPSLGSGTCRSGEDGARPEKGGMAGPAGRKMNRSPCRDLTRQRRKSQWCNRMWCQSIWKENDVLALEVDGMVLRVILVMIPLSTILVMTLVELNVALETEVCLSYLHNN
ncbi:hypothetical protein NDU88_003800 [Pleurodeles waltl]|uniref:Uncharacterized protein n=1 Tax=Pleurodeles waltl TaxID=8319 RepID=A0AAV7TPF2_PLEWA|nr:hypothetical protein NDU88_003800 [Pleurodeles waltl]